MTARVVVRRAGDRYLKALDTWNDCIGKLGCTNAKVRPRLQVELAAAKVILDQLRSTDS